MEPQHDIGKATIDHARHGRPVHTINPFLGSLETKVKKRLYRRGNRALVNLDGGEVETTLAGFWEAEEVDAARFVKLFVRGVKALAELTPAGTRVFELLYVQVQETPNADLIYFAYFLTKKLSVPMSKSTYARGLAELLDKGFLALSEQQSWYWLNPSFVWNGDRLTFVQQYFKKPAAARSSAGAVSQPLLPFAVAPESEAVI